MSTQASAPNFAAAIPDHVKNALSALATIRQTILVNQPQMLAEVAPAINIIENEIEYYWHKE